MGASPARTCRFQYSTLGSHETSDGIRIRSATRRPANAGGAPILDAGTVEMMATDHVGMGAGTQGPGWGFGYGWAVLVDPAPTGTPESRAARGLLPIA